MELSRRHFLAGAGAVSLPLVLAACGFAPAAPKSTPKAGTLTFTTWGTDSELAGFTKGISAFQAANPGATVTLNAVPYKEMFTNIDAQLQAGNPPDIFRVQYYNFGSYAGRGQLLDLSTQLDSGFRDRFTPAAWSAVQNGGKPFGVPHHTDTSAILYNKAAFETAGVGPVPTAVEDAWTWDEFEKVAQKLRDSMPADKYPFAVNWQGNGVTRWLNWLFQADGRFLEDDLVTPAIKSKAGATALDFTRSFFPKGFVPPSDSVQSSTLAADIWFSQTSAMGFAGAFLIPSAAKTLDFDWGATFFPRNVRAGGDLGGNALVATSETSNPELAASFLDFMTQEQPMRDFCSGASLLPTRADLVAGGIEFAQRSDLSPVFVGQASVVQAQDAGQVASPDMTKIITVLKDQLELAFVGGQSTDDTLTAISAGIAKATGG